MDWFWIISVILGGLALIIVEVFFIPGVTFVGVLGLGFIITGIAFTFRQQGNIAGWVTLGITAFFTVLTLFVSFKAEMWKKFSLKTAMSSKVNEGLLSQLHTGAEGVALSALRPSGKAQFNNQIVEVRTWGEYVSAKTPVTIKSIQQHQIFVEPCHT